MSLELRDFRGKLSVRADCALEAYATANDLEKGEAHRQIMDWWADKQIRAATLLQQKLASEGITGTLGE